MKRNYYTFAELIAALRNPYQESQTLLNELLNDIKVESDEPHIKELKVCLKGENIYNNEIPRVFLEVLKKTSFKGNNILGKIFYDEKRPKDNFASFELVNDDDFYIFEQENILLFSGCYQPKVTITNQINFSEKYDRLQKTPLYNLPSRYITINNYQDLWITGDRISLKSQDTHGKLITIAYESKNDQIEIDSIRKNYPYFLKSLLLTEIPSYIFPDEYLTLLESNDRAINDVIFENNFRKRTETASIKEKNNKLVLKRKGNN